METAIDVLGLIAGNRSLPLLTARQAREMGVKRLVAVAFENETDPALAELVDEIVWLRVGQLSRLVKAFQSRGVTRCVMVGQIAPKNLFDLRPDLRTLGLLMRVKEKNAHTLFGALIEELAKDDITVVTAVPWLAPLMPGVGCHHGPALSEEQTGDVAFGFHMAKEITRLEIGQLVVVKNGMVLAVEGFEGTDACLRRGGQLAGTSRGAVAVKVARHKHDMRFDIPCIGLSTLEACREGGVDVLAVEAGTTLFLDRDEMGPWCRRHKLSLLTVAGEAPPRVGRDNK